jgi:hypothetical protein
LINNLMLFDPQLQMQKFDKNVYCCNVLWFCTPFAQKNLNKKFKLKNSFQYLKLGPTYLQEIHAHVKTSRSCTCNKKKWTWIESKGTQPVRWEEMNKATRVELGGTQLVHGKKTNNVRRIESPTCARKGDRKGSECWVKGNPTRIQRKSMGELWCEGHVEKGNEWEESLKRWHATHSHESD